MTDSMMKLARVHGPDDVRLDDVPVPTAGAGEVVVRVAACGICGSDLGYIARGGLAGPSLEPLPIGHEFSGEVVSVGAGVEGVAAGLRVAVNPDDAYIGGGGPEGAMAPYIRVTQARIGSTLYPLAGDTAYEEAALAEPLSVALHALRIIGVQAHHKVAVLGAGSIGLCAVAMLRHLGCQDIAILDRVDARLVRAKALGAAASVNTSNERASDALCRIHGEGARFGVRCAGTDCFIDCAGAEALLQEMVGVAKYRARFAIVALYKKPAGLDLFKLMANEILLSGSIADDRKPEFGEALDLIASHRQDLSPLISHRIDFSRFAEALDIARDAARSAKVVLTFGARAS
ncbi:MAG TPA: zinc-binding dehydrogenase [Nevskiaceae bacterium]|nr:zinc-binding dehydrogenase [Nevskiaceae bacterium]